MVFRNELYFLSNMYPCKIRINGLIFDSAESAFQSFKTKDLEKRKNFQGIDGYTAKRLGKKVTLRNDWNFIRLEVMGAVVRAKFRQHPELLEKLKQIEGDIVENNTWNDTFWGVCNGKGQNHLGQILMAVRDN